MSPDRRREIVVTGDDAGARLDVLLAAEFGSRARAQRLIDAGLVTIAGSPAAKSRRLCDGETVVVEPEQEPAAPEHAAADADIAVVFEDEHLLVVDKPAGLVVHPAPGNPTGTLVQLLAGRVAGGDESWRAGLVHRLDRDTSGLIVLAKTPAAHAELKRMIAGREVERTYTALVRGRPSARSGTIDAPIGRDRRHRTRQSIDTASPREARTHFEVVEILDGRTLLTVRLETGRTHQIRVHLEAIGHPVVGDPVYGAGGELGLDRQFLHASRLRFSHPADERIVDLRSPLPPDLARALESARSHSRGT